MYAKWPPPWHVYKFSWSLVPRLMTYDPLSFLTSARLLCYLTVGMGCWFANICMCLWRYFPVLWRLTRISDAIWITMECSCLDIDIHLLEKCAGRRIKIYVKVSHFDMFSPADLCTLDMVNSRNISSQVPDWPTYFGAGITWSYSQSKQ